MKSGILAVAVGALLTFVRFCAYGEIIDWADYEGLSYTVPAGAEIVVSDADIAAYNRLASVGFADATGKLVFTSAVPPAVPLAATKGTIVKDSDAEWTLTTEQTAFRGNWIIARGVLANAVAQPFGDKRTANMSVTVKPGATLVNTHADLTLSAIDLHLAGTGTAGQGAFVNTVNTTKSTVSRLFLDDDALVNSIGYFFFQGSGAPATPVYDLAGHTLTCSNSTSYFMNGENISNGTIYMAKGEFCYRGAKFKSLEGGEFTVRLANGTKFDFYNDQPPFAGRLVVEDGATAELFHAHQNAAVCGTDETHNNIAGPVYIGEGATLKVGVQWNSWQKKDGVSIFGTEWDAQKIWITGQISGPGSLDLFGSGSGGYGSEIYIGCPSNDYTGTTFIRHSSKYQRTFRFGGEGAIPDRTKVQGVLALNDWSFEIGPENLKTVTEIQAEGGTLKVRGDSSESCTVELPPVRFRGMLWLEYDPAEVTVKIPQCAGTSPRYLALNGQPAAVDDTGVVGVAVPQSGCAPDAATWGRYPEKWFYISQQFDSEERWTIFSNAVVAAAAAGYNAVVPQTLDRLYYRGNSFSYLGNAIELCERLGMEIIPMVWGNHSIWSALQLSGMTASYFEDVPFEVKGRTATVAASESVSVVNGGFEDVKTNKSGVVSGCTGWTVDKFGVGATIDTEVKHGGKQSFRFDLAGMAADGGTYSRLFPSEVIPVSGGKICQCSAWIRAEGITDQTTFSLQVYTNGGYMTSTSFSSSQDGEWERKSVCFDLKEDVSLRVYVRANNFTGVGRYWVDDVELLNLTHCRGVVRRDGLSFTVKSAESGRIYEEGRDYEPIPCLTKRLHSYEITDETPELALTLTESSAISDGERLLVSYNSPSPYYSVSGEEHFGGTCLSNPALYEEIRKSAECIALRLNPKRWFINVDEHRSGGTCEQCLKRNTDMAHILGDSVNRQYDIIRSLRPDAEIISWSDMFCPHHNAHDNYFTCRGTFAGVWDLIPKDIIMVDWYRAKFDICEDFFRTNGFRTLCGGYYDTGNLVQTTNLVEIMNTVPGELGFMYCTWVTPPDYDWLAGCAKVVDELGRPTYLTCTWTGGATGDWADPANWDNPPEPRAVVRIPAGVTVTADESALRVLNQLKELVVEGRLVLDTSVLPNCAISGTGMLVKTSSTRWTVGTAISTFGGRLKIRGGSLDLKVPFDSSRILGGTMLLFN